MMTTNNVRGVMILAPMGTGKSYFLSDIPDEYDGQFIDGDALLADRGIKNRNNFWYIQKFRRERETILEAFEEVLADGVSILYSGNPKYMRCEIMVIPDGEIRWNRLQNRNDFRPTRPQWEREEIIYNDYRSKVRFVINGDIPSADILVAMRNSM